VWPTGQADLAGQLAAGGYLPATAADTFRLPPAVAAHAVHVYTGPGDLVLDPDCGAGTVLVEAVRAGRHAVGVTGRRWWPTARANLTAAKLAGAPADGMVLDRRPAPTRPSGTRPGRSTTSTTGTGTGPAERTALAGGMAGRVDLILTVVRPHQQPAGPAPEEDRLADSLAQWAPLLRPGGHAVVIAGAIRRAGRLVNLPGILTHAARQAGLVPVDRCVALLAAEPDRRLAHQRPRGRTSPTGRQRRRTADRPLARLAHLDVFVFASSKGEAVGTALRPVPLAADAAVVPAGPAGPVQPAGVLPVARRWAA